MSTRNFILVTKIINGSKFIIIPGINNIVKSSGIKIEASTFLKLKLSQESKFHA